MVSFDSNMVKVHLTLERPTAEGCCGESMWAIPLDPERFWPAYERDEAGRLFKVKLLNESVMLDQPKCSGLLNGSVQIVQIQGGKAPEIQLC